MSDYRKAQTSAEVWAVILAKHADDLVVFGSYSAPDGDRFGDPSQAVMFTSYGFSGMDYPIMEARTTWDAGSRRDNEQHEYWLCSGIKETE